ncbi:MAG: glycosyltransferase family 8 protein [Bacteroidales bacterium]|nr:glycosyltransferase family 8 protein [Bacteroidales bacterium]
MDIVLCTDPKYAVGCGVCISSIVRHNDPKECNFHIFTNYLPASDRAKFEEIAKTHGCTIEIIDIDNKQFSNLSVSETFPVSIYYRYLAPSLLNCDKSLYFDCDIVVNGSIKELWNTDITDVPLAAIEDQANCLDPLYFASHIGPYNHSYFNSGVLLLNHRYWREHNTIAELTKSIEEHPSFTFADQDALNFVLRDKVKILSHNFNYQSDWAFGKWADSLKNNIFHTSKQEAIVIHYCYTAPWIFGKYHPMSNLFFKELEQSPWRDYVIAKHSRMEGKVATILRPLWWFDRAFSTNFGAKVTAWIVNKWLIVTRRR